MYYDFQVHASKSSSKNIIQNGKTNISRTMEVTFLSGIWLIIIFNWIRFPWYVVNYIVGVNFTLKPFSSMCIVAYLTIITPLIKFMLNWYKVMTPPPPSQKKDNNKLTTKETQKWVFSKSIQQIICTCNMISTLICSQSRNLETFMSQFKYFN